MAVKTTGLMTLWIGFFDWLYMLTAPLAYDSKYGYSTENFLQLLFIIGPMTLAGEAWSVC